MDHRISKDMISNGMTPSGQKSQQDLSRSQYGSAATPASLAEAYRKIHEMNAPTKPAKPPARPGTPGAASGGSGAIAGRYAGGNTMQRAGSAPMKNVQSPSASSTPKSDEPLATLNRAKKGDGYFGPTVSAGGYRMGIPNPIRKEEVEQVNEAGGPALPGEPGRPGTPKAPGGRPHLPGEKPTPKPKGNPGLRLAGVDLFDIVKGYLIDEGLSEEDALKKMLEMTEEEKAEIVEGAPYVVTNADKRGNTPAYQGLMKGAKNKLTGKPLYVAAPHLKGV